AQPAEGRLEGDAHLRLDPAPIARAEPEHDAAGGDAGERGGLHGEQRGMPRVRVDDAQADGEALGDRGGRGGQRVGTRVEVVLDDPHAPEARALGGPGPRGDARRHVGPHEGDARAGRPASLHHRSRRPYCSRRTRRTPSKSAGASGTGGSQVRLAPGSLSPPEVSTTTMVCSGSSAFRAASVMTAVSDVADEGSTKRPSSRPSARWASKSPSSVIRTPAPPDRFNAARPCHVPSGDAIEKGPDGPAATRSAASVQRARAWASGPNGSAAIMRGTSFTRPSACSSAQPFQMP